MTHRINTSETQLSTSPDNDLGHAYGTILLAVDGDWNTRQLRSHERDGNQGRNIGGITTTTPSTNGAGIIGNVNVISGANIGLPDGSYYDVPNLSSNSARGFGATFVVDISNEGSTVQVQYAGSGQFYKINDTVTLSGAEFGSTEGNNVVISVATLASNPRVLNPFFQVQKLDAGQYSLDHGYEGQIMYFTPRQQSAATAWDPQHCLVTIARARLWGGQSVSEYDNLDWYPFESLDGDTPGATLVHLMYIEGAWVASGGTWD
jgi:hypothetical protein